MNRGAREERRERDRSAAFATSAVRTPYVHAANSAALLRDSRVWYNRVRPGILLYGIVPPPLASTLPLDSDLTLGSRVVAVKGVRPGEGVGGVRFSPDTAGDDRDCATGARTASIFGSPAAARC